MFVELKARFDEEVNVGWARALEAAGGHVVRGLVGFKNHAKVALVVRREGEHAPPLRARRHGELQRAVGRAVHRSESLHDGRRDHGRRRRSVQRPHRRREPPRRASRALLVAPHHLLPGILEQIDREAAHARAGRPARITAKFNGLSDPDVVRALYRASRDGVEIDLVVRGICTLAPGRSRPVERIRVMSVVGRFLEHSRIYRFANGGRRAVLHRLGRSAPAQSSPSRRAARAGRRRGASPPLDEILELYLDDPTAWELRADGSYEPRGGSRRFGAGDVDRETTARDVSVCDV